MNKYKKYVTMFCELDRDLRNWQKKPQTLNADNARLNNQINALRGPQSAITNIVRNILPIVFEKDYKKILESKLKQAEN